MRKPKETRESFVNRVTALLPLDVPEALRERLAGQAYQLADAPQRQRDEMPAELVKEARSIQRAAKALTQKVDAWHARAGVAAIDARALQATEQRLHELLLADNDQLKPDEVHLAMTGADPLALRMVLLGLQIHLGEATGDLAEPGRPQNWRDRLLVQWVFEAFAAQAARVGKPKRRGTAKAGDWWGASLLSETCRVLLQETGGTGDVEKLLKSIKASARDGGDAKGDENPPQNGNVD